MTDIKSDKITNYRPASKNANAHTQRGLRELEKAVQEDGWIAPITAAADGEVMDGSARLETAADRFGEDVIVVHHDGKKPVIMVRDDIPNAHTPEARRIAIRANRIAELDLAWNPDVLLEDIESGLDLSGLFDGDELAAFVLDIGDSSEEVRDVFADVADEFDSAYTLKSDMAFPSVQPFGIPEFRPDRLLEIPDGLSLWPGDDLRSTVGDSPKLLIYSNSCQTLNFSDSIMAFYTDDIRFESVWNYPDKMATRLLNAAFLGVVSPNFSLWPGQAQAVHIFNIYRSRWVGRYFQETGINVLPDVNWSDREDFEFCFCGVPQGCHISIQVQTFDKRKPDEVEMVRAGISEALRIIKPEKVLFYASKAGRELINDLCSEQDRVVLPTLMDLRREKLKK